MASVAIVEAALRLDAKQFTKTIEQAKADVKKFAGDSRAIAAGVGAGLLSASVGLGAVAISLRNSADAVGAIGDSLAQAFSGNELDRVAKQVLDLGALEIFSPEQFATAAKRLNTFGKDVESNLTLAADIASRTGASFDSVAESLARFGKDEKGTKALLKLAGISPAELEKFGAVLNEAGTGLDITGRNAEKAQQALEAIAQSKFSGAFMDGADSVAHLTAEWSRLQQEVGQGLDDAFAAVAGKLVPVVAGFRGLSDETKKLVGFGVLAASIATGLGAIGIAGTLAATSIAANVAAMGGLAAVTGTLTGVLGTLAATALPAATLGFTALTAVFNPLSLAVLAVAAIMKDYILRMEEANQAAQDLLDIEEGRADAARKADQFVGKSAAELQAAGKTAKDVAAVADGLTDRAQQAYEAGNKELGGRLRSQIAELRQVQKELAVMEGDRRQEQQIRDQAKAALGPAPDQAALDAQAKAEEADRAQRQAAEQKAEDERTAQAKAAHEQRIRDKQAALNKAAKLDIQANYPVAKAAEDLTAKLKAEQDKRLADQIAAADAAYQQAKQNADDLAAVQDKGRDLQRGAINTKISDLQANTEQTGTDNTAKIKAAFAERSKLETQQILIEAEKERAATQSAEARKQIEQNAALEIQATYRQTSEEFKRALQDQQDALDKARQDAAKKSTLGQVMSLQDALASTSLNYGVGRQRNGSASSSAALLPAPVVQPLQNADSGLQAAGASIFDAAKIIMDAAKTFKDTRLQVDVKSTGAEATARPAPSGDGRQGSLVTTGRSIRRKP